MTGYQIAWIYDDKDWKCSVSAAYRSSQEANARLIAAAPDLLEVAKESLNVLLDYVDTLEKAGGSMNYGRKVIKMLMLAIAKAEAT
jgi:hypothetical protein